MIDDARKTDNGSSRKLPVIVTLAAIVAIAFGTGFLLLPRSEQDHVGSSMHSSMHASMQHALGHHMYGASAITSASESDVPTDIVWDEVTIHAALSGDAGRGEKIATSCAACHGERGVTKQDWIPTLAGIDRLVLYKELADYRSEKRLFGPMSAIAQSLTPQESADVAAFFSTLPGIPRTSDDDSRDVRVRSYRAKDPTVRLVYAGDPQRGIPGCATCHGPGGYRLGVPGLSGQNANYLDNQLSDFAHGIRRNDMNMPMRTIARLLTADERGALADYYAHAQLSSRVEEASLAPAKP
jgi:cytochrome c553